MVQEYQKIGSLAKNLQRPLEAKKDSPQSKSPANIMTSSTIGYQQAVEQLSNEIGVELSEVGVQNLIAAVDKEYPHQPSEEVVAKELYNKLRRSKKLPSGCRIWGKALMTLLQSENEHGQKALRIAGLLGHFPQQEQSAAVSEVIANDYIDAVKHIPAYALDAGVKKILSRGSKYRPRIKELVEASELQSRHYLALTGFIQRLIKHWGE